MTISLSAYKKLISSPQVKKDSKSKKAFVTIGGIRFFARSSWEANIACYYESLKVSGEILRWEHEPKTFWFEEIRRGVRSYLPDFRITKRDGTTYYVEVKGHMDAKSKTKIRRMAKYYPEIKLEVIDSDRYREIKKSAKFIKGWGIV